MNFGLAIGITPASRGEPSRAPVRFPPLAGGTLRRGLATTACCELWFGDWQVPVHRDLNIAPTPTLPAGGEGAAAPPLFTGEVRADKGTSLGFTVCRARPPSALTPSPSPTSWERGAARGHVWSAEASASAWAEASLPHSIIPLARLAGEGDKGGEGNTARPPVHAHAGKIAPASAILCRTDVPLSALDKGGEGREWGDSTRAGIGELWLGGWYNKLWTRDWYHMRLRRPSARSRAAAR